MTAALLFPSFLLLARILRGRTAFSGPAYAITYPHMGIRV